MKRRYITISVTNEELILLKWGIEQRRNHHASCLHTAQNWDGAPHSRDKRITEHTARVQQMDDLIAQLRKHIDAGKSELAGV